jgi:DNA-binding MarR family transcriptional regulator
MSTRLGPSLEETLHVRDHCLCLHVQRAARALARRFDDALRPLGINQGQFSLLMSLNRPDAPTISRVAAFLAMDRTTLTAVLKPLERRGLLNMTVDKADRRNRRLTLTDAGRKLLRDALPIWTKTHATVDTMLAEQNAGNLRGVLALLV